MRKCKLKWKLHMSCYFYSCLRIVRAKGECTEYFWNAPDQLQAWFHGCNIIFRATLWKFWACIFPRFWHHQCILWQIVEKLKIPLKDELIEMTDKLFSHWNQRLRAQRNINDIKVDLHKRNWRIISKSWREWRLIRRSSESIYRIQTNSENY